MSSNLFEGEFIGKVVKPEVGMKKGKAAIRIEMEVTEGDKKGRRVAYEGQLDEKNIKYTKRAMLAVGWQGKTIATFVEDVKKANLTVPFTVKIASWQPNDGRPLQQWSSIQYIGGGSKPLDTADADTLAKMDRWFAEAGDVGGGTSNGTNDDLPF